MQGSFRVAQATGTGNSTNSAPARVYKLTKPLTDQAVIVNLGYDQKAKVDFSSIANEKITLVHIGEKLIILFDNQSTVTVEPFFDSRANGQNNVTIEMAPGRDVSVQEFASLFPISTDSSVLPAADNGGNSNGNAQASGANFSAPAVDPLDPVGTNVLAGPETLPGITTLGPTGSFPLQQTPLTPLTSLTSVPLAIKADSIVSLTLSEADLTAATNNGVDGSLHNAALTSAKGNFAADFTVAAGTAGILSVSYTLSIPGNGTFSGLIDSQTQQHDVLVQVNATTIEGHVGGVGGALAFTITVDSSGIVTFTEDRAVDNHSGPVSLAAGTVTLTQTVVGNDASTASASVDLGPKLSISDDHPTANPDNNSVAAGSHVEIAGNVITGAGESNPAADADVKGADGASVTSAYGTGAAQAVTAGGTTIAGAYGTLVLHSDGSYTYDRAANTPGGVSDVFHYTLTDGDGDQSSTTLTIAIGKGTPELGSIPAAGSASAIVYEAGLPVIGSHAGQAADPVVTTGTIGFTSPDGVQTVSLGGHVLSSDSGHPTLFTDATGTVSAWYSYDGSSAGTIHYSYTLTADYLESPAANNGTDVERQPSFAVVVTDLDGQSTPAGNNLVINVVDDVPTANPDNNSVAAGSHVEIAGNVITGAGESNPAADADVKGADGASVTSAYGTGAAQAVTAGGTTIAGAYGTLVLHSDGSYTYDRAANTPGGVSDVFHYTLTDGDGDQSSTTLTIAIGKGTPELGSIPAAGSASAIVYEAGLPVIGSHAGQAADPVVTTGTIGFTSPDGVQTVSLGGHVLSSDSGHPTLFTDATGTVSAWYSYDGSSAGTIHYSYTLTADYLESPPANNGADVERQPSFAVVVTDLDGQSTPAGNNLVINVVDDVPTANPDNNSVAAGSHVEIAGNVITGAGESNPAADADVKGADGASVTSAYGTGAAQAVTAGGTTIAGAYGTLVLHSDGSYTYDRAANTPGGVSDVFHYTLTDGDGDQSSTTLTIAIGKGTPELGSIPAAGSASAIVYEAGLPVIGSHAGQAADPVVTTGTIGFTSPDGVQTVSLGGHVLSSDSGHPTLFTDATGTVSAWYSYDGSSAGTIHYSYTLTADYLESPPANNGADVERQPSFAVVVTDLDGQSTPAGNNLVINVVDDVPTANPDNNSVAAGSHVEIAGNVITGAGESNPAADADVKGADGASVTSAYGTGAAQAVTAGGTTIAGAYGTLVLHSDGSYTYDRAANTPGGVSDVFHYTLTDGDGDQSSTTLTIAIGKGTPELGSIPAAGSASAIVYEAGLPVIGSHAGQAADPVVTTGTIGFTSPDGVQTVSLGGHVLSSDSGHPTVFTDATGTVSAYYTYDGTSAGTIHYSYTLTSAETGSGGIDPARSFPVSVTDLDGQNRTGTLTINVIDDHPTANADTNSLISGQTVAANVESNDVAGADGYAAGGGVVGVAAGTSTSTALSGGVGSVIHGTYGDLTLQANGSYSYAAKPNVSGADNFVYTIQDGDGNTSTTTLKITVNASGLAATPDTVTVNEAGLATGSLHDGSNVTSGATLVGLVSGGVGADTYSLVGPATGAHGTIVINGDGTFTYTLTSPVINGSATELADTFTYQVKDSVGNTVTNTITVNALDDHPTAVNDTASAVDGGPAVAVLTDAVTSNAASVLGNDALGADRPTYVTSVTSGATTQALTGSGASATTTIVGADGKLTLNGDGTFSYTPNPNVKAGSVDTFTYTITDADGTTSQAQLAITIKAGAGPTAGGDTSWTVHESSLPLGTSPNPSDLTQTKQVTFTAGADDLHVTLDASTLTTVLASGYPALSWTVSPDGQHITGAQGSVNVVQFDILSGATINAGTTGTVTVQEKLLGPILGEGSTLPDLGTLKVVATDTLNGGSVTDHITANVVDDAPIWTSADHGVVANVAGISVIGGLQFTPGADGLGSLFFTGVSTDPLHPTATTIQAGGYAVSEYVDASGVLHGVANGADVFKVALDPTTSTYSFYLLHTLDAYSPEQINPAGSPGGSGPAAYAVLSDTSGNPVTILTGYHTTAAFDVNKWLNETHDTLTTAQLTQDSVKASSTGEGVHSNGFNAGDFMRFDLGAVGDNSHGDTWSYGTASGASAVGTGNQISFSVKALGSGASIIDYVVHSIDGTVTSSVYNSSTDGLTLTATGHGNIDYVELYQVSGASKVLLAGISEVVNNGQTDVPFTVGVKDGDGNVVSGSFDVNVNGGTTLSGTAGNDVIVAGATPETLTGNGGDDKFVLNLAAHQIISDFNSGDLVLLDVAGLSLPAGTSNALTASQFTSSAATGGTESNASAWTESGSTNKFFFNNATHELWYSANGTGSDKVDLAHLSTGIPAAANIHIF
ncbi:tandem-95 repeat protein [Bradyrhizobium sp. Pha-3]|uniref:tandem-95 repeat protein n=1 Tax=Bradyrhizobium sp. Pha-3 TaxID=208375 RepID=UPI0035D472A7